ncbi:MAG: SLBB domain-containing protein, partial [Pseudomonadota bacterium]
MSFDTCNASVARHLAAVIQCAVAVMAALVAAFAAPAVAQTPSAGELALLEQLSPAQRELVLEQIRNREMSQPDPGLQTPALTLDPTLGDNDPVVDEEEEPDLRLLAGDTVAVTFTLVPLSDDDVELELSERVQDLIGRNVFELNSNGVLVIDDFYFLPLGGLLAEEAAIRIAAEPDFRLFDIEVTRLPLAPIGAEALSYFGYDLFENVPSTFAPVSDAPVPGTYTIGPGDAINLQLFGEESADYALTVQRDGTVNLPEIGPVAVAGLSFDEMRSSLVEQIESQNIGVKANVTMGELRTIGVFVLGDAERPGAYTVSGLSTMTNALLASGGIRDIGSLRRIELKRDGRVVGRLDLYDLLLRGDMRADQRLQPGDVIFVPPVGAQVAVDGAVRRPAWYELDGETTIGQAIALAGGLNADAYGPATRVERIDDGGMRLIVDVDPTSASGRRAALVAGDMIRVGTVLDDTSNSVRVTGHAQRPGLSGWRPGMRLTSLVPTIDAVLPNTDLGYVLIRREDPASRRIEVLDANLADALAVPGGAADVPLRPRDELMFFDLGPDRSDRVAG